MDRKQWKEEDELVTVELGKTTGGAVGSKTVPSQGGGDDDDPPPIVDSDESSGE